MILDSGETMVTEYINARTKVKIQCINGHEYEITPNNYKKGRRCMECFKIRQKMMMDDRWNGVVSSVKEQCDSNVTTPTPKKTPKPVVSSVKEQCDSNVTTPTPVVKELTKLEYNKKEWAVFIKTLKDTAFKLVKQPDSNGTLKYSLVHTTTGKDMTIWIMKSMDTTPKGVTPIYLDCSNITEDIEYIKTWMTKCIREEE